MVCMNIHTRQVRTRHWRNKNAVTKRAAMTATTATPPHNLSRERPLDINLIPNLCARTRTRDRFAMCVCVCVHIFTVECTRARRAPATNPSIYLFRALRNALEWGPGKRVQRVVLLLSLLLLLSSLLFLFVCITMRCRRRRALHAPGCCIAIPTVDCSEAGPECNASITHACAF